MASSFFIFSLILTTITSTTAITYSFSPLSQPPSTSHLNTTTTTTKTTHIPLFLLPQPPQTTHKAAQLSTIIDAIIGATDFSNWANLLATADISTIPLSATLFISSANDEDHRTTATNNPLLHMVPRRFSFSELQLFPIGAHLPTLLPGTALVITNNSAVNFTINAAKLTKPDIYQNAVVSVHGVDGLLGPPLTAELRSSGGRSRRKRQRKSPSSEVEPQPPTMVVSAAGVKRPCSWGQVVMVVFLVLLVLHILGLPRLQIVCSIEHGPEGHFRYFAGCSGNFFI